MIWRAYFYLSGAMLLFVGGAKIWSGAGDSDILATPDPIFAISFRFVFLGVGLLEFAAAIACIFIHSIKIRAIICLWMASCFVLYRIGLNLVDYRRPCPCLGTFTDALHIDVEMASLFFKGVIVFLAVGSILVLSLFRPKALPHT